MKDFVEYTKKLNVLLSGFDWTGVEVLADSLESAWYNRKQVFLCGNGGSAANAIHLSNDFLYGVCPEKGLNVTALSANQAVITCLGNDTGYENIYYHQLKALAKEGDIFIVLSGSGNSANLVKALELAKEMKMETYGILGFSGGRCKELVDHPIHFAIDDMQISEDCQTIVGHMLMQRLNKRLKQ